MVTTSYLKSLFLLDPSIIFLNHGSFGATPKPVFDVYQDWQRKLETQPVEFLGRQFNTMLRTSREKLADYLGSIPENLVFVPNATHGINIVARSLHLTSNDEILTTNHEYGAMNRTWQFLAAKEGFSIKPVTIPFPLTSDEEIVKTFENSISKSTKLIFLSHISSPTSIRFPVEAICKLAKKHGIITIIDGAHAPGQINLALDQMGVDFYTGNCHKWLCAPKGSAFLYTTPKYQSLIEPLIVSWGWMPEIPGESQYTDYLEWTGTRDIAPYLSVPAAIDFQKQYDWSSIRAQCHQMASEIQGEILNLFGNQFIATQNNLFNQMVSIPLPKSIECNVLKEKLYNDFRIEIPIVSWEDQMLIRVSVQGYNSQKDLESLLESLKRIYSL
jgi:isopenicillin-N epimerase